MPTWKLSWVGRKGPLHERSQIHGSEVINNWHGWNEEEELYSCSELETKDGGNRKCSCVDLGAEKGFKSLLLITKLLTSPTACKESCPVPPC